MIAHHAPAHRRQAGFQFHFVRPTPAGWTVTEIWDSQDAYSAWFDANMRPNLPIGVEAHVTPVRHTVAH